jgi:hypothetical protein
MWPGGSGSNYPTVSPIPSSDPRFAVALPASPHTNGRCLECAFRGRVTINGKQIVCYSHLAVDAANKGMGELKRELKKFVKIKRPTPKYRDRCMGLLWNVCASVSRPQNWSARWIACFKTGAVRLNNAKGILIRTGCEIPLSPPRASRFWYPNSFRGA